MPDVTVTINPTKLDKSHKIVFKKLLEDFTSENSLNELRKSQDHYTKIAGQTYKVKLTHSISKSSQENEFYIRTKEMLGEGSFGKIKRSIYRLLLTNTDVSLLPGMMAYKRFKFLAYFERFGSNYKDDQEKSLLAFKRMMENETQYLSARYNLKLKLIEKNTEDMSYSAHLFLPYIPGTTLSQSEMTTTGEIHYSITKSFPLASRLDLARKLFKDLRVIHQKNIVHLDLKPKNIIVGDDDQIHAIDLGLAMSRGQPLTGVRGTPGYLSPEVCAIKKSYAVTGQEDMYASAVVFFDIFTGQDGEHSIFLDDNKLNVPTAKTYLADCTDNVVFSDIFPKIFENLADDNPNKRMSSEDAELAMGLLQSKLFQNFLADIKMDKPTTFDHYSLRDLHYFQRLLKKHLPITNPIVKILFGFWGSKLAPFLTLMDNDGIKESYDKKIAAQMKNLIAAIGQRSGNNPEKNAAIAELKEFAEMNTFTREVLTKLTTKLEKLLRISIDVQFNKRMGSAVISDIFEIVDPFLLEDITPMVLQEARKLKATSVVKFFKSLQPKKEVPITEPYPKELLKTNIRV